MIKASEEELQRRELLNDISSGDDEMLSNLSEDDMDHTNFVPESLYDVQNLRLQMEYEEMKQQDINLRERMSTSQLIKDVKEVNTNVQANHRNGNRGLANPIKFLVSKQKRRYSLNGFNLDLTYITERIIAMGYPAENFESVYRNSMEDVQRFFNNTHPGHYKIYNLCSERNYPKEMFNFSVARFPFEDHQAPTFGLIYEFCVDLDKWLKEHENNVAGIHCKAGKGRTGVMICCFMLYSKQFQNAYDSMRYYGMIRTKNRKGVTIPSQIRYIFYFEKALNNNWMPAKMPCRVIEVVKIRLIPIPNYNMLGGCEPWFRIQNERYEYNSKKYFKIKHYKIEPFIEYKLDGVICKGDVLLQVFNNSFLKKFQNSFIKRNDKMFQLWFNCDFFGNSGVVMIDKFMLDKACKVQINISRSKDKSHKKFPKDFRIEIHTVELGENSNRGLSPNKNGNGKFGF